MRGFLRTCPSNIIIRFLFARCQAPSLSGRITLADDLLFRCLAHRARTALRPSSLLCSGVSLENRTFPPLRPPSLPSATAFGFFAIFFAIRYVLVQIDKVGQDLAPSALATGWTHENSCVKHRDEVEDDLHL